MLIKDNNSDKSHPKSESSQKESSIIGTGIPKRKEDKMSSFEQFEERGYDSGFVFHEE